MILRASFVAAIIAGLSTAASAQNFVTIDFLGAIYTEADGINDSGQIVGTYLDAGFTSHGFLKTGKNFSSIDFPGAPYTEIDGGINSSGQIVGWYSYGGNQEHGFLYAGGNFSTIPDFPGAVYTQAQGISDSGQIVGTYADAIGGHGFLYSGGNFSSIDFPGATNTNARGINGTGQIVGTYRDAGFNSHGFLYSGGSFSSIDFPGAINTFVTVINQAGQIVGTYQDASSNYHGFKYSGGNFSSIDFPGASNTEAGGLNDGGQIVGFYRDAQNAIQGFLYTGGCQTLTTPPPLPGSHWYQLDPNWAGYLYDSVTGPHNTIRYQGCALTGLNYLLNTEGQNFTPQTLNIAIGSYPGDYSLPIPGKPGSGGGINFSSAVMDVTGGNLKFDKSQSGQTNTAALDSYLCASPAYPVLVSVNNPSTGQNHYVVVTGQASNGDYSIVDPGYLSRTHLSDYGTPVQFQVAGVVKPPSGSDPSELDLSVVDYATLLVTAPDGTQTGYDPGTGKVLKGSKQSAYFAVDNAVDSDLDSYPPTSTTYSVQWFLPPNGNYTVELIGLQLGSYELAIRSFDANGQPQTFAVVPGIANVGSTSHFQVQFSSTPGLSTTVIHVASFPATLADINNSLALSLIRQQAIANSLSSNIRSASNAESRADYASEKKYLNAFVSQVNFWSSTNHATGGQITGVAPQVLLSDANSLLSQIP
jgi:probable HAF family extracellular repeat protein